MILILKYLIFPFLDGDVPRSPSYGVYISQLIRFAGVYSNVDGFNIRNLFLTAKLLKQPRMPFGQLHVAINIYNM